MAKEEAARWSLIEHFSGLEDPRQAWNVEYPLAEIMPLVLCATLAGADGRGARSSRRRRALTPVSEACDTKGRSRPYVRSLPCRGPGAVG